MKFKMLEFITEPSRSVPDNPYTQFRANVAVDSCDNDLIAGDCRPRPTPSTDRTAKHIHTREHQEGLTLSGGTSGFNAAGAASRKDTSTKETIEHRSGISAVPADSVFRLTYYVDDDKTGEEGLRIEEERLPTIPFRLRTKARPDKPLKIELSSCWRLPPNVPPTSLKDLWHFFRKRHPRPLLRNFCHVTIITLPPHLSKSATSTLRLEAWMPCSQGEIAMRLVEPDCEDGVEVSGLASALQVDPKRKAQEVGLQEAATALEPKAKKMGHDPKGKGRANLDSEETSGS